MIFEETTLFKIVFGFLFLASILSVLPHSFWMLFAKKDNKKASN